MAGGMDRAECGCLLALGCVGRRCVDTWVAGAVRLWTKEWMFVWTGKLAGVYEVE